MKFQPGHSGNPAGRPPGSRNKKTLALEETFDEHAEEILKELIARAKDGEKTAMRLCVDRMLAPKRERPVVIALPVIETTADARKAIGVVTAELAEGSLTITEATRLIGLIQRVLRLVTQIDKMEQARREDEAARAIGQSVRESIDAYLAQDGKAAAAPQAAATGAPGDPALYFPVNSENAGAADGFGALSERATPATEQSAEPPLAHAA